MGGFCRQNERSTRVNEKARYHTIVETTVALAVMGLLCYPAIVNAHDIPSGESALWYKQPAQKWEQALPVGNGRLGAMVFGGIGKEGLQLNLVLHKTPRRNLAMIIRDMAFPVNPLSGRIRQIKGDPNQTKYRRLPAYRPE